MYQLGSTYMPIGTLAQVVFIRRGDGSTSVFVNNRAYSTQKFNALATEVGSDKKIRLFNVGDDEGNIFATK
jgi:hypothetical protein